MKLFPINLEQLFEARPGLAADFIMGLFTAVLIILAGSIFLVCLRKILKSFEARNYLSPPFIAYFYTLVKWLTIVTVIMVILQQAGIKINSLWTVISAVLAMIAIGFVAVWSVLSNLLCTLMLIIFHPFRVGDEIEIIDPAMTAGLGGRVRNINLVFTSLRTPGTGPADASTLHIPNNLFFQKIIRMKKGGHTYSLDKQLFEENSLLNLTNGSSFNERT
jgi:small-conductance mechanosensitive channel